MRPSHITLGEIDSFMTSPEPLPPILQSSYRPQSVAQLIERDLTGSFATLPTEELARLAREEWSATMESMRTSIKPLTVLHAITLEDGQSRAAIAARMGVGPEDVDDRIEVLRQTGMITVDDSGGDLERFSLTRPAER